MTIRTTTTEEPRVFASGGFTAGSARRARLLSRLGLALCLTLPLVTVGCDAGREGSTAQASTGSGGVGAGGLDLPESGEVTIVAMPDIQWYSLVAESIPDDREDGRLAEFLSHFDGGAEAPRILASMHDWILDEEEAQSIVFVTYLGDIVERGGAPESLPRWRIARESLDRIHGRVPYGIAVGNHDMATATGDTRLFSQLFGEARYANFTWYQESRDDNVNSVQRIPLEAGGHLLFLHLTCNAPASVLEWADGILRAHLDDHVFISTHMLLGPVERHGGPVPTEMETGLMRWTKCYGEEGIDAQESWDQLFRRHPQIRAILSGDQSYSQALHEVREGDAGNRVLLMMSDYKQESRDGYLRLLRYHPESGRIRVVTWSPVLGQLLEGTEIVPERERHQYEVVTGHVAEAR